jgi:ATP-dependent phosphoenolpyruvate carboxykinase
MQMPTKCTGVPPEILNPSNLWSNKSEFSKTLTHLADLYQV